jgi:hypothetical protein
MSPSMRRYRTACLAGATAVAAGCHDGLLHPPAAAGPAELAVIAAVESGDGGAAEAFTHADQIVVRLRVGDDLRLEEQIGFDGSRTETQVSVQVPLRGPSEELTLDLELRMGAEPLFRGTSTVTLVAGGATAVDVTLTPVISAVSCAGETIHLSSYGEVADLSATPRFATGDSIVDGTVQWTTDAASVVRVDPTGPRSARVTALQDGTARIACAAGDATDSRTVEVFAVVRTVLVSPSEQSVMVGGTATFTATLRDGRQNVITGRPVSWTSSNTGVASVSTSGVATGLAAGTSTIRAASGDVSGTATLTVVRPTPPAVVTGSASDVGSAGATLNGTVNPNGFATEAWYEWGTSSSLASFSSTAVQSVGSGTAAVATSATLSGLGSATTYYFRHVARNSGGTTRGSILSFTTVGPPTVRTLAYRWVQDSDAFLEMTGGVTPNGAATTAWLEWSEGPDFRQFVAGQRFQVGAGFTEVVIEDGGFMSCAEIYFRVAAVNEYGTVRSNATSAGQYPLCVD